MFKIENVHVYIFWILQMPLKWSFTLLLETDRLINSMNFKYVSGKNERHVTYKMAICDFSVFKVNIPCNVLDKINIFDIKKQNIFWN